MATALRLLEGGLRKSNIAIDDDDDDGADGAGGAGGDNVAVFPRQNIFIVNFLQCSQWL